MGLFQSKQSGKPSRDDQLAAAAEQVLDEAFREELKDKARLYFDRVINENAALFKQDLDATVAHINTELKQHVARQLDDQFIQINKVNTELKDHVAKQLDDRFAEYDKTMKEAQVLSLQALERSSRALEEQHRSLSSSLEKSVANQDAMVANAVAQNKASIEEVTRAQGLAVQVVVKSAQALEEQRRQLNSMLEKGIADQQAVFVETFEQNMARIIEHYLLGALGDAYDLKAQLPAIIKQMEANKQAIVDDMKL